MGVSFLKQSMMSHLNSKLETTTFAVRESSCCTRRSIMSTSSPTSPTTLQFSSGKDSPSSRKVNQIASIFGKRAKFRKRKKYGGNSSSDESSNDLSNVRLKHVVCDYVECVYGNQSGCI